MNGKDGRARNSFHKSVSLKFDVLQTEISESLKSKAK